MKDVRATKYHLLLAGLITLAAALLWAAPGQAQTVTIAVMNPQFTADTLSCAPGGNCDQYGISGWITGPSTFILKAGTGQYPTAPATGLYVAALGNSSATGSIFQQLSATVQPNMTYAVKIAVGARADVVFTGYQASLLAGNTVLASNNRSIPVGGTFVYDIILYNSGATPAQLGQPLQVFIKSVGTGQANIANVTVTSTPSM